MAQRTSYISHVYPICIGGEEGGVGGAGDSSGVRNDCDPVVGVIPPIVVLNCKHVALVDVGVGNLEINALHRKRNKLQVQ